MSRHFISLTVLALAGSVLVLPTVSAQPGALPAARPGAFRGPMIVHHTPRAGILHRTPQAYGAILQRPAVGPGSRPGRVHSAFGGFSRDVAPDLRSRFVRRQHRGIVAGFVYPLTDGYSYDEAPYLGTPYDPAEAIPVYTPAYAPAADDDDAAPAPRRRLVPRLSSMREEGQDACRSETVTVPESKGDGEREITIVRC